MKFIFVAGIVMLFSLINISLSKDAKQKESVKSVKKPVIGTVVFLRGKATKILSGTIKEVTLKVNDTIASGDIFKSEEKSIVKFKMVDESVLTFGPKSKFNFRKFKYDPEKVRVASYQLLYGRMRAKFRKTGGKSEIVIDTRTAALGIRGTEILMNAHKNAKKEDVTQVALLTGKAEIVNKQDKHKYILTPGKTFIAVMGTTSTTPRAKMQDLATIKYEAYASATVEPPKFDTKDPLESMASAPEPTVEELSKELFLEVKDFEEAQK
jgi:hypothetical protein